LIQSEKQPLNGLPGPIAPGGVALIAGYRAVLDRSDDRKRDLTSPL
jgi:hypothetical protein